MQFDESQPGVGETTRKWEDSLEAFDSFVLVSNRQPYRHQYGDDGAIEVDRPTGGLTAALDPVVQRVGGTWIAWGDGDADRAVVDERNCVRVPPSDPSYTLSRLWLDEETVDSYYEGYSNRVLWPLCHGFPEIVEHRPGDYDGYRRVNDRFAERATEHADDNALVWLQDYHLALAPAQIDENTQQTVTIGQFWHIPWPKPETFATCPQAGELLEGLLGTDLLSFHVDRFASNFLACVDQFRPEATVDYDDGVVSHSGGETVVTATPLGIDAEEHARESYPNAEPPSEPGTGNQGVPDEPTALEKLAASNGRNSTNSDSIDYPALEAPEAVRSALDREVLCLGVDRLDYTKGIPARIEAIERTLERWPELRGSLVLVQTATPSRTNIPAYAEHGERVRDAVDRVNDRFRTDEWEPIVYTETYIPRPTLCTLYRRADIMLVTSHSDGMNLVAKEFVASSVDDAGALCLSDQTGAAEQLGDLAYTVDPDDPDAIASTIDEVLSATSEERRHRMQTLRERVHRQDIDWWMDQQFEALGRVGSERRLPPTGLSVADRR